MKTFYSSFLVTLLCGGLAIFPSLGFTLPTTVGSSGTSMMMCTDLVISGYVEGSGNNKCIEIYNGTGAPVDLSTYSIDRYTNGSATVSGSFDLSGTLADGSYYIVCNPGVDMNLITPDATSGVLSFNGDDAVALNNNGTNVDVFGQIGVDPGSAWMGGGISTQNQTVIKNFDPNSPCPFVTFDGMSDFNVELGSGNYSGFPPDDFSNLNSQVMADTEVSFAAATYSADETDGTVDICVSINNAPMMAVSVDVVLTSGDAAALGNYMTQTVTFPANDGTDQCVTINITDNTDCTGSNNFTFALQNPTGGMNVSAVMPTTTTLTVSDDEQPSGIIAFQGFEGTANDNFTINMGAANVSPDAGAGDTPANERIRTGAASWQVSNETATLVLDDVTVTGSTGVTLEVRLSSTALTTGNGADGADEVEIYAIIDGMTPVTADIEIEGNNNARYGYDASLVAQTTAGTPVVVGAPQGGTNTNNYATAIVNIPDGTSTVGLQIVAMNNSGNEVWNIDDISLSGNSACPAMPCTADAGTNTVANSMLQLDMNGEATIMATADGNQTIPTDYEQVFVLTETVGSDLIIRQVNTSGTFTVMSAGDYTVHVFVAETTDMGSPNFIPAAEYAPGQTAAQLQTYINDNSICAALETPGSAVSVAPAGPVCDADNGEISPMGPVTVCAGDDSPEFTITYNGTTDVDPNMAGMFPATPLINELRIDQPGTDNDEFFELLGAPGTDLSSYTLLVLGDNDGGVENATDLSGQTIPADGIFLAARSSFTQGTPDLTVDLFFENSDNLTFLLVENFTGAVGDDLDADDDGVLDMPLPYDAVIDDIALVETPGMGDAIYSSNTIGPDMQPNGDFVPAHVYRDMNGDFQIGQFATGGPNETPGQPNFVVQTDFQIIYVLTAGTDGLGAIVDTEQGTPQPTYPATFTNPAVGTYTVVALSYEGSLADFNAEGFTTGQEIADAIANMSICAEYDTSEGVGLTVVDGLVVANIMESACTAPDASGTYTVSFEISGGQAPVTINGEDVNGMLTSGTVTGSGTTADPFVFTSNAINSGDAYSFTVSDAATNCPDPDVISGAQNCDPCATFEGPEGAGALTSCAGEDVMLFAFGGGTPAPAIASSLFISEYIEGGGNNKAIEIFNGTGADIDFDAGTYEIYRYANGSPNISGTTTLTGILADGDVYVVANGSADAAVLAEADLTSGNISYNGDDAVALAVDGILVDVIGRIGEDPGSAWLGGGLSTQNRTLIRKPEITMGDPDGSDDFNVELPMQFDGLPQDDFSDLGMHTFTATMPAGPFDFVFFDDMGTEIARETTTTGDSTFVTIPALPNGTYNYTVQTESAMPACMSAPFAFSFTVNESPTLTLATTNSTSACIGGIPATITAEVMGGTPDFTYTFTVNDMATDADGFVLTATDNVATLTVPDGATTGTVVIEVQATDDNGCTSAVQTAVIEIEDCEITISDPCVCLNNATTLDNGQFGETVTVEGPAGQTFTVVSVDGLFLTSSPAPPADPIPIPLGTELDEVSPGVYELEGIHVDGVGYSVTVQGPNGDVLSINSVCFYPTPFFVDLEDSYCLFGDPVTLMGDEENGADGTISFTIDGTPATVFDPMALGFGTYTVALTFDAGTATPFNINDPGCVQTIVQQVVVIETTDELACNDLVQLTLDDNCEAELDPDKLLESNPACDDDYLIEILGPGGVSLGDVATGDMVGSPMTYRITYLPTGNSCWGMFTVEDKSAPVFDCVVPAAIECTDDIGGVPPPVATDNCDPNPTVVLADEMVDNSDQCGVGTFIQRTYIAYDENGFASEPCVQNITILTPGLPTFPESVQFTCEQFAAFPNITEPTERLPAAFDSDVTTDIVEVDLDPNLPGDAFVLSQTGAGTPTISQGVYCPYSFTVSDDTLATCGSGFKIVRTFVVIDWCAGALVTTDALGNPPTQIIKVVDDVAPTVTPLDVTVNANVNGNHPQLCAYVGPIPAPTGLTDNCGGDAMVRIFSTVGELDYGLNEDGSMGGSIPAPGLPIGTYPLIFSTFDGCGNSQEFLGSITVEDNIIPSVICDEITQVTLTNEGTAVVPAAVFDDGSYDNCCLDEIAVRRLNSNMVPITVYGPDVTFDCSDVTEVQFVELRVTDCFGNFSSCMVQTFVEDKSLINLTCPPNATINCFDFAGIEQQLTAAQTDAERNQILVSAGFGDVFSAGALCDENVDVTISFSTDMCGEGSITRTFTATGANGATSSASCTIDVIGQDGFEVIFPADVSFDCTDPNIDIDLDDLSNFGMPQLIEQGCGQLLASESVEVFTGTPDACYKIVRTFTAVDMCGADIPYTDTNGLNGGQVYLQGQGLPGNRFDFSRIGTDNVIRYAQVILVDDNEAPVIVSIPDLDGCITESECARDLPIARPEVTDCTDSLDFNYVVFTLPGLNIVDAGSLSAAGEVIENLAPGSYRIVHTVDDMCGNSTVANQDVTISDCKKPSPICMNGLVYELMQTGMLEINARMLDLASFDNCTDTTDLRFSFTPNPADSTMIVDCGDVGQMTLNMYVTDEAGNTDFCTVFVIIQDNMGACDMDPMLAGRLETESGVGVSDVDIDLSGMNMPNATSETDGTYQFNGLLFGGDYTITPAKTDDIRNGVTTLDLYAMNRHILGIQPLDSPYKIIAADVNNSGQVTALDVAMSRMVILHLTDEFPNNTSWRFVDMYYDFQNPSDPLVEQFPEIYNINDLNEDMMTADFIAIKVGDVNGSVNLNGLHGSATEDRNFHGELPLELPARSYEAGESFELTVHAGAEGEWLGMQGTLHFDASLELLDVRAHHQLTAQNFGLHDEHLTMSYAASAPEYLHAEAPLFTLVLRATAAGKVEDAIRLSDELTVGEAYMGNTERLDLALQFSNTPVEENDFRLFANRPNPFSDETLIDFYLPSAETVTLRVFDAAGREVYRTESDFSDGYQQFTVDGTDLSVRGMLLYRLESELGTLTGKMIRE